MGALTNAAHAAMLNWLLGTTGHTASVKVRLTTTTPTQTTAGTEVSTSDWTNYAAITLTNNSTSFPNASVANPSVKENGVLLDYTSGGVAVLPGSNVTLRGVEYWDSANTTRLAWFALSDRIVQNGDEVKIAANALDVTLAPA